MEIHKPKPWHGWREFTKEIGTIVIGVLIALAAEQAAEALHRRHEVHEARRALDSELSWNLMAFELRNEQVACASRRLDELERWADRSGAGAPAALTGHLGRPVAISYRSAIWRAVANTVAEMPLQQRLTYAEIYDDLENAWGHQLRERALWQEMDEFRLGGVATPERRGRLKADIEAARGTNNAIAANRSVYMAPFATLRIKAVARPLEAEMTAYIRAFCTPLQTGDRP